MFSSSDRQLLKENNQLITKLNDRLDVHGQLVEMNRILKELVAAGSAEQKAEAQQLAGEIGQQTDQLADAASQANQ